MGWEQGSGTPFPSYPEGGGLGLKGFAGERQPFPRELLAAVSCSGEPEIVFSEGGGLGGAGAPLLRETVGALSRAPSGSGAAGSRSLRKRSWVSQWLRPPPAGQPPPSRLLP